MKGRKPLGYRLRAAERHYLREIVGDGQQPQRVARRARTLLALDRGERIVEILRWLGVSRMGVWHLCSATSNAGRQRSLRESGAAGDFSPRWRRSRLSGLLAPIRWRTGYT